MAFLICAGNAAAEGQASAVKVMGQVNVILGTGPKGTEQVTAKPDSAGLIPQGVLSSLKPHGNYRIKTCPDGNTYIFLQGTKDPCPDRKDRGAFIWFSGANTIVVIDTNAPEGQGVTFEAGGAPMSGGVTGGGGGGGAPMGVPI